MMAVVRAFENKEYTLGRDGAIFFFLEYINYLDEVNAELENTERFAIDLSSHVTYAFVMATGSSKERVIHALESLGWPFFSFKFQSAVSTMAGISILYTYNAYIILTFFKTIWLTMLCEVLPSARFCRIVTNLNERNP
ncbi:hypothetical protein X798_05672 [Onchocerca flexuosa]|uniref:Uncharacterized protein n=1 Tax=Onchocerca flexuosa TaxID=387005 RepID=A0A238BR07_9BILA|nr:hypothetical protein X798_05672 [Onchocerca flexuosa]